MLAWWVTRSSAARGDVVEQKWGEEEQKKERGGCVKKRGELVVMKQMKQLGAVRAAWTAPERASLEQGELEQLGRGLDAGELDAGSGGLMDLGDPRCWAGEEAAEARSVECQTGAPSS